MLRSEAHCEAIRRGQEDRRRFEYYVTVRQHMAMLWDLVTPQKIPARRRREDRQLPKKAA